MSAESREAGGQVANYPEEDWRIVFANVHRVLAWG